jgi:2-polyprenyl-3-methyl-5-hydroxy-6-metoxy-1,4-benzoquinol methylase
VNQSELAVRLHEEAAQAWEPEVVEQADHDRERTQRIVFGEAERCLVIGELAAAVQPRRVLEVGIGYLGIVTTVRALLGPDVEISAVDHPARAYIADPRFLARVKDHRVDLEACDVLNDDIPFDGLFDVVFFCDVIEHLPVTRVPGVVEKLAAKVRPGGRLIMSSTNLGAFMRVASLAFGNGMVQDPPFPFDYAGGTYGHIRLYGRADVEVILDRLGLDLVEWRYLNWERHFLDRDTRARRLMYLGQAVVPKLFEQMSTSWICAATPRSRI